MPTSERTSSLIRRTALGCGGASFIHRTLTQIVAFANPGGYKNAVVLARKEISAKGPDVQFIVNLRGTRDPHHRLMVLAQSYRAARLVLIGLHPQRLMMRGAVAVRKNIVILHLEALRGHVRRIGSECLLVRAM
jgi:hypothetical protein